MTDQTPKPEFVTTQECNLLADAMEAKYQAALKDRSFSIDAKHEGRAVYCTVLLSNDDESFYYPVEARVLHEPEELSPREAALFLIDYIDTYFEEFLMEEDESIYVPIDWADHEYDAVNFQIRGQILNRKLDEMADSILRDAGWTPQS
jgi:elongation factor P hydroxylase